MTIRSLVIVLFFAVGEVVFFQGTEAGIISTIVTAVVDIFASLIEFIKTGITNIVQEALNPPENRNSSIQYLLFTPETPDKACYLESNLKTLKQCPFNSTFPMKIFIHGFRVSLGSSSLYWQIKDRILELYEYNVIVVNWTNYNQLPYLLACINAVTIAQYIADFIHFLQNNTGIEAEDIHLIGHSLGAHVSGMAGRRISNLKRITALDPAAPLFYPVQLFPALTNEDADFVDVIHTSNLTSGFGMPAPIGDMDFYPNGGSKQPQCQTLGANYTGSKSLYTGSCNHKASLTYFLESINTTECVFLSTICDNYTYFLEGLCSNDSSRLAEMGLPAQPILGLDPKSKFYLRTRVYKPYCIENGYEPN